MIVVMRKRSAALILLVFLLSIAVYSLNVAGEDAKPVTNAQSTQKVILLDPGHGGEDPGAVSDYSGLKEKDVNLNIALTVKDLLEKSNYKVIMSREEDRLEYQEGISNVVEKRRQDLNRRKKLMDEAGADIVVSIHLNKFPQTQYFGAQVFYPPDSTESRNLAVSIQNSLKETVDPENKRVAMLKDGKPPIIILRDVKTTTAIVECGFLSNKAEEEKLTTKEYQEKIASAIKNGIDRYFQGK